MTINQTRQTQEGWWSLLLLLLLLPVILLSLSVAKKYTVDVVTGNVSRAGTDANVFITLFGENSDSGERPLSKSETNKNKFEKGQVDLY